MAQPCWDTILTGWWGGSWDNFGLASPSLASNFIFGSNPPFQVSDFLAFYPKFGTGIQGLQSVTLGTAGLGYAVNDLVTLVQADASGGVVKVLTLGAGGSIATFALAQIGSGYSVATVPVTGGTGTGATFNITGVSPVSAVVPTLVLVTFINLASAHLSQSRWLDSWYFGMALFVAHFTTLYLRSEGNPGSTPGAIARSGLEAGITVSASSGNVSKSVQTVGDDLPGYAAWKKTEYGTQLATMAKIVGMGASYIR